ncbi:MAG: hypothetical protein ACOYWZ_08340 [Bacillota bacterium]
MNRVERYREIRLIRRKCLFVFLLSLSIVTAGIFTVDHSISNLMNKEKVISMVRVKPFREDYYHIRVFNKSFFINTKYIKRDMERLKNWFSDSF